MTKSLFLEYREKNVKLDPFNTSDLLDYNCRSTGTSEALPFSDLGNGKVGFVTYFNDRKLILEYSVFDAPMPVKIHNLADMDRIIYDNLSADYPVYLCEDPHNRLTGFIVHKNSGAKWFHISLETLSKEKNKDG